MKSILCVALILFGCALASAQEKIISQAEFEGVYKNSSDTWRVKPHRLIVTNESKVEGRPQTDFLSKTVTESASPTETRAIYETSFGGKISKREAVKIGDKTYSRNENESWQEGFFESEPRAQQISGSDDQTEIQAEYKFLGAEKFNDQNARVYAKIVKTKRIERSSNSEILTVNTTKYWFGENGVILKSDTAIESRNAGKVYHTRSTQIWESAPDIKIEAPKLN